MLGGEALGDLGLDGGDGVAKGVAVGELGVALGGQSRDGGVEVGGFGGFFLEEGGVGGGFVGED